MAKQPITNFYGKQIATIEDITGKKYIYDFFGKCLGYYEKDTNATYDFFGRKIGNGEMLSSLIKKWD